MVIIFYVCVIGYFISYSKGQFMLKYNFPYLYTQRIISWTCIFQLLIFLTIMKIIFVRFHWTSLIRSCKSVWQRKLSYIFIHHCLREETWTLSHRDKQTYILIHHCLREVTQISSKLMFDNNDLIKTYQQFTAIKQ